jgi:hypothetical protein
MNRGAPASRLFGRTCVTVAALVALSGAAQAQLVQPPPAAEKPAAPVKIDDLKKSQTPPPPPARPAAPGAQPAGGQPAAPAQPVDPATIKDRPNMVFDEQHHGFGKIVDTEDAVHTFKFTNKGNKTLVIADMHATCGCTLPNLEKKEYEPGESGEIKVTYNPRNKHGVQNQTITITTNDPANPRSMLTIQADVQPMVSVEPTIAQSGVVRKAEERKITVTVTLRDPEAQVTDVTSSEPEKVPIKIVKSEKIELDGKPANRVTIEALITNTHPVGDIRASGTIRTTDKNKPVVSFQVVGNVQGDIYMQPARVSFGSVRPGDPIKATTKLTHRDGKPFKITSISADTPSGQPLNVTFAANDPANPTEYVVEVTGTAMQRTGVVRGDLMITTDVPMETQVRLPFFGTIRAAQ